MRILQQFTADQADALSAAIVDELGLDPRHVSGGITAEWSGGESLVVLRWTGVAALTAERFDALLAAARPGDAQGGLFG